MSATRTFCDTSQGQQVFKLQKARTRLCEEIVRYFPEHTTYVEALGGVSSLLLFKAPSPVEYYNDTDQGLVDFFRILRFDGEALDRLVQYLEFTPYSRKELNESKRTLKAGCSDQAEYFRALLVSSWMSRMSMLNETSQSYSWAASRTESRDIESWHLLPTRLRAAARRLKQVYIECRPAIQLLKTLDSPETLFYLDPLSPNAPASIRNSLGDCTPVKMVAADHEDLLTQANLSTGKVIISGRPCRLYDRLLKGWHRVDLSPDADPLSSQIQSIWMNFKPNVQLALSLGEE